MITTRDSGSLQFRTGRSQEKKDEMPGALCSSFFYCSSSLNSSLCGYNTDIQHTSTPPYTDFFPYLHPIYSIHLFWKGKGKPKEKRFIDILFLFSTACETKSFPIFPTTLLILCFHTPHKIKRKNPYHYCSDLFSTFLYFFFALKKFIVALCTQFLSPFTRCYINEIGYVYMW